MEDGKDLGKAAASPKAEAKPTNTGSNKGKIKLIVIAVAIIVVLIVIAQNTDTVETKILFLTVEMPRAALLFLTTALGFVAGLLTGWRVIKVSD